MKHKLLELVENSQKRDLGVDFGPGDNIKVHYKINDGGKERIQIFQGDVISKGSRNFTVRKISSEVGIERIIPLNSPQIDKIEVVKRGKVRRAKLYYLRDKKGKAAKIKERKQ